MRIKVKLFSIYREVFKSHEITLEFDKREETVESILNTLIVINERFSKIIREFPPIILINGVPSQKSDKIYEDSEVVLLPPASGGLG